jgi:hypothetical protein
MEIDWGTTLWVGSTLLGTVIGAFFSWWSTHTVEKMRVHSERERQFHADRKILYIKLLRSATELSLNAPGEGDITNRQRVEFMNLISEVEVLASPLTRKPALDFIEVVKNYSLRPYSEVTMDDWLARRNEFIQAVHKELGITTDNDAALASSPASATGIAESWSKLKAQSQMPLPVVTGIVGLLMAFAVPNGLSGGQGFAIGFVMGVILVAVTARQAYEQRT